MKHVGEIKSTMGLLGGAILGAIMFFVIAWPYRPSRMLTYSFWYEFTLMVLVPAIVGFLLIYLYKKAAHVTFMSKPIAYSIYIILALIMIVFVSIWFIAFSAGVGMIGV